MAVNPLRSRDLNRRITIQRPIKDNGFDGAGSGTWETVATVWAEVEDILPRRSGEQLSDGLVVATRLARVRMWYRTGVTPDMRFVMGGRVMQIVGGPAEIGLRQGLEFTVEDYSSPGNAA